MKKNILLLISSLLALSAIFVNSADKVSASYATPTLLKDINPGNASSSPLVTSAVYNGKVYFEATEASTGKELWVSDGTADGTQIVKDINPGSASSSPYGFTVYNGKVYFEATDGTNGLELWVTDGTSDGTYMLKDIWSGSHASYPVEFTLFANKLYFVAGDITCNSELWVTDGTATGTAMLKDIRPGNLSSSPSKFTAVGNQLFFFADDGVNGTELWVSDGTADGTQIVKDIYPGGDSSFPESLTVFDDKLYFQATTAAAGTELWVSDGTADGTQIVKDINPGSASSLVYPKIFVFNNLMYFQAEDGTNGAELWKTDGTVEGTILLKDIYPGSNSSSPVPLIIYNDKLYFIADDGEHGNEFWTTDGATEGTQLFKDIRIGIGGNSFTLLSVLTDRLYFSAYSDGYGTELWVTDGTDDGTKMLNDVNPGASSFTPARVVTLGNKLIFQGKGSADQGTELWVLPPRTDKTVTSFVFADPTSSGIVNEDTHTVTLAVPSGTDVTTLTPTIFIDGGSVSPGSGVAKDFTSTVSYTVTGYDSSTQDYTVIVMILDVDQTSPDGSGSATLTDTTPEVLIPSLGEDINVTVSSGTVSGTINYDPLITDGTGTLPQTTINKSDVQVVIPSATIVTSTDTSWNGVLEVTNTATAPLPDSGDTLGEVLGVGQSGESLSFDKGVRIKFTGEAGKRAGYTDNNIISVEITDTCSADSQEAGDALIDGGTCKIDVGSDLVVWTRHFTTYFTYSLGAATESNSSSVNSGTPSCGDERPASTPDLFQINTTNNSATLYFTPISNTNEYAVSFSENSNAEEHGEIVSLLTEGVQSHTVYFLKPNTTYYFRVRGQKGCAAGAWSTILKAKTDKNGVFYKYGKSGRTLISIPTVKKSLTTTEKTTEPTASPSSTAFPESQYIYQDSMTPIPTPQPEHKFCILWWCW